MYFRRNHIFIFLLPIFLVLLIDPSFVFSGNQTPSERRASITVILVVSCGQLFFFCCLLILAKERFFPSAKSDGDKIKSDNDKTDFQ